MSAVRFIEVDLRYGCHGGRFEFPDAVRPIVLAGPNGAGKTTLLEAMLRTLFGFNRQLADDRGRLVARQPWDGSPCRASVLLAAADGSRWRIAREFESTRVELEPLGGAGGAWAGDGNPAATNVEAVEYRRRLRALFGLAERQAYETTACIHQGELQRTRLDEDLLRTAAGGYGNVHKALESIRVRYRELTVEPLEPGDRRLPKPRRLEQVDEQIRELSERLRAGAEWERDRQPDLREREEARRRAEALKAEIEALQRAYRTVADRRALEAERDLLVEQVKALESTERELREGAVAFETAERRWDEVAAGLLYPDDFDARAAALEALWGQRDRFEERLRVVEAAEVSMRPPSLLPVGIGTLALLAAAVSTRAGHYVLGGVAAALGLGSLAFYGLGWKRFRQGRDRARRTSKDVRERLSELDADLVDRLKGIPDASTLTPLTLPDRRDRYTRQQRARRERDESLARLHDAMRVAGRLAAEEGGEPVEREAPVDIPPLIEALQERLRAVRDSLAQKNLQLGQFKAIAVELPDGVTPEPESVNRALEEGREELARLQDRLEQLAESLARRGASVTESPVGLKEQLAMLDEQRDRLREAIGARRAAHQLLTDAYEDFRSRDQERFVERISDHLLALTGRRLGPLDTPGELSGSRIRAGQRLLELASPPLSYGEYHATLLAVRLGAADFLAQSGARPPLIVDEPFAHLDIDRSRALWELLSAAAADRQVVVATQDRLTLAELGVRPDLELALA